MRQFVNAGKQGRECPFCRIAAGLDAETSVVVERRTWVAFFPRDPATTGHMLIIPRAHADDFWQLPPSLAGEVAAGAVEIGQALGQLLHPDGMNLITSAGVAAEQTVSHVHLHVVPRWENDAIGPIWPAHGRADEAALPQLALDVADLLKAGAGL